jgi:type VI secretion system protein ImpF
MPRAELPQGLMPSMLDRLIDPDAEGTSWRRGYSLEQVIDAVRRDLEELLNTHQPYVHFPEEWAELSNSVFLYGMPDLVSFNATEREQIGGLVGKIISRFEPRLRNVRVVLADAGDEHHASVRFHVEAVVNVDPAPEVAFETVVELFTGRTSVTAGGAP